MREVGVHLLDEKFILDALAVDSIKLGIEKLSFKGLVYR